MAQTSKKGFSPILIIVIVAVIAVAGGGYLFSKNGSVLNIASVPRASEKDFPDIKDPILKKHFVAQANTTSYRITSNSSGRGELNISEIQLKGTDFDFHTKTQANGKDTSDYIVMGDTTYIKDFKDNKWWKQKAKPATDKEKKQKESVKPEDFKTDYEKKQTLTYKDLGKEACGALTCYKYEEVDPANAEGKRIFWFDINDYLLRKDQSQFGEFTSTNEYSYDNISINEPSPTKDVPEGTNIYQYLNQGFEGTTPVNTNQTVPQTIITNIPSQNTETIPTEPPPSE